MKKHYVVTSLEHAKRLFPGSGREPLLNACGEMLDGYKAAVLVTLTTGHYTVEPIANGDDLFGHARNSRSPRAHSG